MKAAPQRVAEVFLQPGDYYVGAAPARICTLLGSCVSITLWHPRLRVGAMSHFLLARRAGDDAPGPPDARYGEDALALMLAELRRARIAPAQCEGKIFGGGNMFPGMYDGGRPHVGRSNGEAARRLLQEHGIALASESLFGDGHRHILFDVGSGHVWARRSGLAEAGLRPARPGADRPAPAHRKDDL